MDAKAKSRDLWSKPVRASITAPLDTFQVGVEDGVEVHIRLEADGTISVFVRALDNPGYLKSKTMPFSEFAEIFGRAFFGPDWRKPR